MHCIIFTQELESWTSDFSLPSSVWLSGFFNPQSFLTAIMQVCHYWVYYQEHIECIIILCLLSAFNSSRLFFLTPAAEKTKTQGQNSSKKLKEKTQPLGGRSLPYAKLKKKLKLMKFSPQNSKFSKG